MKNIKIKNKAAQELNKLSWEVRKKIYGSEHFSKMGKKGAKAKKLKKQNENILPIKE